jgi:hypothetical protein
MATLPQDPIVSDPVENLAAGRARSRTWRTHVRRALNWTVRVVSTASDWVFGAVALTIGLAVLAATPIAQLLAFGYLLESGGRVARTGRIRDGFVGVRKASRVGSVVVGVWMFLLPLELLSSLATSAQLVHPGGGVARIWKVGLLLATVLVVAHLLGACARGGRIRHFFLPFGNPVWIARRLRQGGAYAEARDAVWDFVASLRLPYFFRMGLVGFVGTMTWLAIPVSLLAAGRYAPILDLPGILLLAVVVLPLPYLQARFATENRFGAIFERRAVRELYQRAPWAFSFTLALTLVAAVPLYLLKIEMIPRETAWLPSLVFLGFMFPARLFTGWAYGRALRRQPARHWFFVWSGRLAIVPVLAFYLLIVFLSQYTAWRGIWSLYEQHAFLVPVPFLGM